MHWSRKARARIGIVLLVAALGATLYANRVARDVSEEDTVYVELFTGMPPRVERGEAPYEEQVQFVRAIQASILEKAGRHEPIPYGEPREPKDLYEAEHGFCFDRSRTIEKILVANGFRVRHVALYSTEETLFGPLALLTPRAPSHAVTEVATERGWLVVGSNQPWLSLDGTGDPVSIAEIRGGGRPLQWHPSVSVDPHPILEGDFLYVYGLHSRHGYFFPPYVPIPEIHWGDFLYHFRS